MVQSKQRVMVHMQEACTAWRAVPHALTVCSPFDSVPCQSSESSCLLQHRSTTAAQMKGLCANKEWNPADSTHSCGAFQNEPWHLESSLILHPPTIHAKPASCLDAAAHIALKATRQTSALCRSALLACTDMPQTLSPSQPAANCSLTCMSQVKTGRNGAKHGPQASDTLFSPGSQLRSKISAWPRSRS